MKTIHNNMIKESQNNQISGAQRMRSMDSSSSAPAQAVAPSATQSAAEALATAVPGNAIVPSRQNRPIGATAAGYLGSSGNYAPPGSRRTAPQGAAAPSAPAAPARSPLTMNPAATQTSQPMTGEDGSMEVWHGPHDYNGQPVDVQYRVVYDPQSGSANWVMTGELRPSGGGQGG